MTFLPPNVKVHLAYGYTDMRKGMDGLALLVQEVLQQDPFSGHLFVFRGRKANLIKIVFWDGTGLCLFTKRLEHGVFLWPSTRRLPARPCAASPSSTRSKRRSAVVAQRNASVFAKPDHGLWSR